MCVLSVLTCHANTETYALQKINEKCFLKCVTKPSTSLSGSEEVRLYMILETKPIMSLMI